MHLRTREPKKLSLLTCAFGGAVPHVYSSEGDMDLPASRDKGRDQHTMHARDKMRE